PDPGQRGRPQPLVPNLLQPRNFPDHRPGPSAPASESDVPGAARPAVGRGRDPYRTALMRRLGASICAAALGSCIVVQDARAQATAPLPGSRPAPSVANQTAPVTRLNPTNRTLEIYVPFVESGRRLGDILIRLTPDDQLSVLESRLVEILGPAL